MLHEPTTIGTITAGSGHAPCGIVLCIFFGVAMPGAGRAQAVDLGAQVFMDYYYNLSSSSEEAEGLHGFTYRRLNLTTDFTLTEEFRGRARLEASDATTGAKGPVPFVKDLSLTWKYVGDHSATIGVTPPPAFELTERIWGYRSLEKTILDFQGIVASRDFGIRFDGPIVSTGIVRYAVMLANNSATSPETDAYKRVYGTLSAHPTETLSFLVGADHAGFGDARKSSTRVSAFAGYASERFRLGAEGFYSALVLENESRFDHVGVSLFGSFRVDPRWELTARVDRSREEMPGDERFDTFVLGGVSYRPNEFVRLIPNVWFYKVDEIDDAEVTGRFTVSVDF